MFITFEGGEGSGKTTQIRLLSEALTARGIDHLVTREPGGTPLAEKIRPLLVESPPAGEDWHPLAETLLFLAARVQHWEQRIKPALTAGKWVICDRFIDSTLIYQGVAKGLGVDYLAALHRMIGGSAWLPDRTFVLDIDPELGLRRAKARQDAEQRFEALDLDFHQRLREGFLALARTAPERYAVVDANQVPEKIAKEILANALK
jgi:dTMP kinase